jgi:hypothetical protein
MRIESRPNATARKFCSYIGRDIFGPALFRIESNDEARTPGERGSVCTLLTRRVSQARIALPVLIVCAAKKQS